MRWQDLRRIDNVEDAGGGSGGGGFRIGGGLGVLGVLGLLVVGWLGGIDPLVMLQMLEGGGGGYVETAPDRPRPPARHPPLAFGSALLRNTQRQCGALF